MFKKVLAVAALTLAAVFAVPMAANAAGYVPSSNVTVSNSNPAPGQTVDVSFKAGSFNASENVQFTLTGQDAAGATLASLHAVVNSKSLVKPASASGAVTVAVTVPTDATGTYTLTATGVTSGNVGTVSLTVSPADSATGAGAGSSTGGLADTGSTVSLIAIWVAGGLVLLGAAFVAVNVIVRRQRAKA